jgi:murein DD-endopeptidase MepM/ murein hydrolase activator NlpD
VPRLPVGRARTPVVLAAALALVALVGLPGELRGILPAGPATIVTQRVAGAQTTPASTAAAGAATVAAGPQALTAPARPASDRTGEPATAPDPATLAGYRWPLAAGRLTLPFKAIPGGTRINGGRLFHDGIDMASFCGDRVVAAHDGVVLAAGRHFDDEIGWVGDLRPYYATLDAKHLWDDLPIVLITDDGNGYRSIYAHFERLVVSVGQRVRAGQLVGFEGRTGHASGCHVHYGLFSPFETARFGVRPDIVRHLHTPLLEIARIDPLLVLPDGATVLRTRHLPRSTTAPPGPTSGAPGTRTAATGPSTGQPVRR